MSIANNRKAWHDYFIEEKFEAGIVLEGWEVKAIRAGRLQLHAAGSQPAVRPQCRPSDDDARRPPAQW